MLVIMYLFFFISVISFVFMVYHLVTSQRPGIYPSRIILRQRAGVFAVISALAFMLGLLLFTIA